MNTDFQVVFLHGPAAAGKHTIGTRLAALSGLPLFHNHLTVDLVSTLFDFGSPGFRQLRADIWLASFSAAAEARQSFIFTFAPEATVQPGLIDELGARVVAADGKVHYVQLICDEQELTARMDNPSRQQFGKLTDPVLFRQLMEQGSFDFPALPPPLLTVDTGCMSADEAAQAIYAAIINP